MGDTPTNFKCHKCGLVNMTIDGLDCRRCGSAYDPFAAPYKPPAKELPQPPAQPQRPPQAIAAPIPLAPLPPPIQHPNGWLEFTLFADDSVLITNMKVVFHNRLAFHMAEIARSRVYEVDKIFGGFFTARIEIPGKECFEFKAKNKQHAEVIVTTLNIARFGDDPAAAHLRKTLLKLEGLPYQQAQYELVNQFFNMQRLGRAIDFFYFHPLFVPGSLFSVRSWEILDAINLTVLGGIFAVRVDSSNRSGRQITLIWKVFVKRSVFGDYCVVKVVDESNLSNT